MTETRRPLQPPPAVMDMSGYRLVVIQTNGDANGHAFRRGQKATVDAATLADLLAKDMVYGEPKPAG